jgi:teichoic acid transport system permease protein
VNNQGRLSAPGRLSGAADGDGASGTATVDRPEDNHLVPPGSLRDLAVQHGLQQAAIRPPLRSYAAELWKRRYFISGFATARNIAMYTEARLGQLWQVLTPLLNAGVYFFIFGVLLHASRGVPNYLSFLVTGVFVFNFTQRAFITSSQVIRDTLPLIRALYFPRACLPLGYVLIELQQLILSFAVLIVIVLITGEPVTWYWLLIIPALILQSLFNVGGGLILARWGASIDDVSQLLPFLVRTWMYVSGVLFSIQTLASLRPHPKITYLLQINPAAVYISLVRNTLLESQRLAMPGSKPYSAQMCHQYYTHLNNKHFVYDSAYCHAVVSQSSLWLWGVGWAVAAAVVGFLFFWRAEARYGRG